MFRILLYIYSLLFALLGLLVYLPFFALQTLSGKKRSVLFPRFKPPASLPAKPPSGTQIRVWIHAVSVGEVNAVRPLVNRLLDEGYTAYVSTTTETGQKIAQEHFGGRATIFYFPLDLRFLCLRFLRRLEPDLLILTETEIWPNFVVAGTDLGIPTILVNGRISDRSVGRYQRFRFFFRPLIERISHFCMQSKLDKQRIEEIGAPPDRVNWVGNLKFDYHLDLTTEKEQLNQILKKTLTVEGDEPIWLCGSTKPGEEEILLGIFARLRKQHHNLKMLIAPRHPKRGLEIAGLAEGLSQRWLLRSRLNGKSEESAHSDILILDSIGELAHVYGIADLVFMGGSLVPTGGQNVIEAAAFGKPILFGPHMENFRDIAKAFTDSYAALQVDSAAELESKLSDLIGDSHAREWLGRNARKVIRDNQGALDRTLQLLKQYLPNGNVRS